MSTYLWINILTISVPLIATFDRRLKFHHRWYALWPSITLTGLFFILWDIYFTGLNVWSFNPEHLIGVTIFNLPLEEWLFFVTIPYAIVFTYDALRKYVKLNLNQTLINNVTIILALILFTIAIMNLEKIYTSVTFILTAIFLLMQVYIMGSKFLGHFYLSYIIIFMFPFLIVNGILTGSFVNEPVVLYNNAENLSLRIFTIPIEDFIYGMLLYLMNVSIYEKIIELWDPVNNRVQLNQQQAYLNL
ncbi:MAG: lycopene cyclase domain-containing protein [Calditrichaeota bacterium]|nr:lycopene cyclase domain-containing protein [Calditrichota bacterium]